MIVITEHWNNSVVVRRRAVY